MAYHPFSALQIPADDPFFDADTGNLPVKPRASQQSPYGIHQSDHQYSSQEMRPESSGGYLPSVHGNPQHQTGWGLVSPPIAASYFPQPYNNQRGWGHRMSPTAGDNLPQTPATQQRYDLVNPPTPREQISDSQPNSVKHLTCWYWANNGCRLHDNMCLYSHFDTGRLADPPLQVQRGRKSCSCYPSLQFWSSFQTSLSKARIRAYNN